MQQGSSPIAITCSESEKPKDDESWCAATRLDNCIVQVHQQSDVLR
jgi:hypothetical protein